MLGAALLAVLLAGLVVLDRTNLAPSVYRLSFDDADIWVYALIVAAAIASALAPKHRRPILAIAGVAGLACALHEWSLALLGYAAAAIAIVRVRLPILPRFGLAFVAWATVPALRMLVLDGEGQADTILLAQVWIGMLCSALYLVIERARALPGEQTSLRDDAFYLLAPPRIALPFFQPISAREVILAERPAFPRKLLARGAALAGYGLALALIAHQVEAHTMHHGKLLYHVGRFAAWYARAAHAIILAIAAFRLLGYNLPPGFRYPFASRSFAELFRRFNHYVRDAVVNLFYLPVLGHLRLRLPRRAASILSAYIGIFVGSLLLQDLLIPSAITLDPLATSRSLLRPRRIIPMIALWSLIVLPNAGIAPRRRPDQPRWRIALQIVLVAGVFIGLWYVENEWKPNRPW